MGGVWCRADRGHSPTYDSKGPFSAISRWTDHVRQAYRKPKTRHRPPRPPQKPIRTHDRLNISPPQLVKEQSSDGWRTATLIVPQSAPVPPPRKKRRRLQMLERTAYSMDELNSPIEEFNKSTFSLQEKYYFESGLQSKESSSTIVVTPILESRLNHTPVSFDVEGDKAMKADEELALEKKTEGGIKESHKEKMQDEVKQKEIGQKEEGRNEEKQNLEEQIEDIDEVDFGDEIVPVEKETMFTYRTLLHSNLGYIDKLSAISEVSAESGFDDRTDVGKFSERSESIASDESLTRDMGLNILEHIHNINTMDHKNEINLDVREKTARSKKEWLENILKEEPEPYFMLIDKEKKESEGKSVSEVPEKPTFYNSSDFHNIKQAMKKIETSDIALNTPPITQDSPTNHSVLLEVLQANKSCTHEATPQTYVNDGESIFLTNTKTNIIYKSLSSDNLTNDYDNEYPSTENENLLLSKTRDKEDILKLNSTCKISVTSDSTNSTSNTQTDSLIEPSKVAKLDIVTYTSSDDKKRNVMPPSDFEKSNKTQIYVSQVTDLQPAEPNRTTNSADIDINAHLETESANKSRKKENDDKLTVKEPNKKSSAASSRRSSLTDSLHEFEMSIYDMLKESNRYQDSSDEEESVKTIKAVSRN